MTQYSIEPRTRKYVKGYGFLWFAKIFCNKFKKQLFDIGLGALKTASKNIVHKAAEATVEFIEKMTDKIVKPKYVINENSRNVEELIAPPEKREEILNKLRQVLKKWNTVKYLTYWKIQSSWQKWIKVNALWSGQYSVNKNITFKTFNIKIIFMRL